MSHSSSAPPPVVLVGGGHSHALLLHYWAKNPLPGVRLILVSDRPYAPYSGMLPGHVAGFYSFEDCHISLPHLAQRAGAEFRCDRVVGLDLSQNHIHCEQGPPLPFTWLSLNIGSTPHRTHIPGVAHHTISPKPVPDFLRAWHHILETASQPSPPHQRLVVVGGGAGGVELLLAMQTRLAQVAQTHSPSNPLASFTLLHRGSHLMTGHNPKVQACFHRLLQARGVQVYLNHSVDRIEVAHPHNPTAGFTLHTDQGLTVQGDRIIWAVEAIAPTWLHTAGLATDDRGFVLVGDTLQSLSHPHIFASGDIAHQHHHPRPKAGVFAVRQARPLYQNLRRVLQQRPPRSFRPQAQILALVGDAQGRAVASKGNLYWPPSPALWWWKDWIDRRFMALFQEH